MKPTTLLVLVLVALPLTAAPGDIHYAGSLQVEVKEGPADTSPTKFVIAIGRKVLEFERDGQWVAVGIDKAGGREGWVRLSDLSSTDPDGIKY